MKIELSKKGEYVAIIKTETGERIIRLRTKDLEEAKLTASQMDLEAIEKAARVGLITRDLINKLTSNGSIHLSEAIQEWSKWLSSTCESKHGAANMVTYVKAFADSCRKGAELSEISEAHIDRWVNQADGTKRSTRNFRLASVRSFFKFCMIKTFINVNVSELVKVKSKDLTHDQKETRKKTCFTDEEYGNLLVYLALQVEKLEAANPMNTRKIQAARFWYCAVIIGRHTGLRLGDIAALERESINLDTRKLSVWTDKRNKRVEIDVSDELKHALENIRGARGNKCFPEQSALECDPTKRAQLPNQFRRILDASGVKGHIFHELRATRATEMNDAGKSKESIAKELGHTSTKTTEGYIVT